MLKSSRKIHKWLMLFLGVQFVIWSISGAYMVIFDIDYIHGDTLVAEDKASLAPQNIGFSLRDLFTDYPQAENIELGLFIGQGVYRFSQHDIRYLISAENGELLSPLTKTTALAAARHYYSGSGAVAQVELIIDQPPFELSSRHLPAWRVNFDDFASPSLYISASSGKLVTKRHEFWRTFDLMFSLHVMDYEDEDASNQLLFWFILCAVLAAISGLVLTYYRLIKGRFFKNNVTGKLTAKVG